MARRMAFQLSGRPKLAFSIDSISLFFEILCLQWGFGAQLTIDDGSDRQRFVRAISAERI